ncbi:MAG: AraC family transcriptional regulator [Prevotella sp.]|nr:AraC family transcriptional regulator [Prevotella sp.]
MPKAKILNVSEITIEAINAVYNGSHLDNDLIMVDEMANIPFIKRTARAKSIILMLCQHGNGHYNVGSERYIFQANDVVLINSDTVIEDFTSSDDFSAIAIIISPSFFSEVIKDVHDTASLFLFSRSTPVFSLQQQETDAIKEYFAYIRQKVDDKEHRFRREVVTSLMMTMIYDLSNAIYRISERKAPSVHRADALFTQFLFLVEKNFRKERRVAWYSKEMNISAKYLSESVKMVSNRTCSEWIDNYVMRELRALLRNTSLSIKDIADQLNFPNQSFLGTYFKTRTGISPTKYRHS